MPSKDNASEHWRQLAGEAFASAEKATDPHTRSMMLDIAAGYKLLAEHAEKHAAMIAPMLSNPPEKP